MTCAKCGQRIEATDGHDLLVHHEDLWGTCTDKEHHHPYVEADS